MKCDFFVLAEGATNDARGALALVGVNQRAISVSSLPFRVTPKVIIGFTDESLDAPGTFTDKAASGELSMRVTDPDGNAQFALNQSFQLPKPVKPLDAIPAFSYIVAELIVSGNQHGIYSADVSYKWASDEVESRKFLLYIIPNVAPISTGETPLPVAVMS